MSFINPIITPDLLNEVLSGYSLDIEGIHGIQHWEKVEQNALQLAKSEGIKSDLFSLFALFHDARRKNDLWDKNHGRRGADLAKKLHAKGTFQLSTKQLAQLCYASEYHTHQKHHDDPIIGICWDADRLALPRVGKNTNPLYLNSATAILWAQK